MYRPLPFNATGAYVLALGPIYVTIHVLRFKSRRAVWTMTGTWIPSQEEIRHCRSIQY